MFHDIMAKEKSNFFNIASLMSVAGKVGVFAAMAGMVIIPNFWLAADLSLLLLFWLVAMPTIAPFPMHYSKRYRNFDCPMNKVENRVA
jgi:hypothetical protein